MGRKPQPGKVEFRLKIGLEQRKRLERHADRLGYDMTNIARDAILKHLDELDQRELVRLEASRAMKARNESASPYGSPKGLALSQVKKRLFPEKIERSFRRFAEYLEAAPNEHEREARAKTVVDEIRERIDDGPIAVDEAVAAFKEFMTARADGFRRGKSESAMVTPIDKVVVAADTVVAGDVDDSDPAA